MDWQHLMMATRQMCLRVLDVRISAKIGLDRLITKDQMGLAIIPIGQAHIRFNAIQILPSCRMASCQVCVTWVLIGVRHQDIAIIQTAIYYQTCTDPLLRSSAVLLHTAQALEKNRHLHKAFLQVLLPRQPLEHHTHSFK